ncbi:hypothetical protein [Terasakiispira papahanaumokuakeensis]|nr:hypothetical protein [Terasakiispira papahanaumokuakeensis]
MNSEFSRADANFSETNMDEGDLMLNFKGSQGIKNEVFSLDIVAFKW